MSATQRRLETPPAQSVEPALISVREWAAAEGIGRDLAYRLIDEGRVRHVRIGRVFKVPRSEIEAFAEREARLVEGGDRDD